MPQISQLADTYFSQIFWMVVFFGLTFLVVGRGMLPKVVGTMVERNQHIAAELGAAQAARAAAEAEQAAWAEKEATQRASVHAMIATAKHDAATASQTRLTAASARIDAETATAESAIHAAQSAALADFEMVAADLTRDIASRVAGLSISADEATSAVKGSFAHA